jgi:hypothetical protein
MSEPKQRIIGGVFGLEVPSATESAERPPFALSHPTYFLNARCAIHEICRGLKPRAAWLPSYLCSAVVEPFSKLGVPVRYYDIGSRLKPSTSEWVTKVQSSDLVVAIHYFGFANKALPAEEVRRRGGCILEDASQAFFARQQYQESFGLVFSARKFFGVPDGGVLVTSRPNAFDEGELEPPPMDWWRSACTMTQMRREFDLAGGENRWFSLFKHVEENFPLGPYRCSDMGRELIETGVDYQLIKKTRRENYMALAHRLGGFALFPELDDETVPLGFPVCVDASQRDRVLEQLYAQGIYPPVHWRLQGMVPEEHRESHLLSRRILTLICDQRYTVCDMKRQTDAFLSAIH